VQLSVCITTYNHEEFIEQAIQSVLEQETWFDFNVIVGLDASTDETPVLVERMAKRSHGRVKVNQRPHRIGVQSNFIRTVREADGEFVAFLEGDDFWTDKLKLQKQVDFLIDHPQTAFCCHRMRVIDNASGEILPPQPTRDLPSISDIRTLLVPSNPIHLGTAVTRRPYLHHFPSWFDVLKFPDLPLWFLLSKRGMIGYIPEEMACYRLHSGSAFSSLPSLRKTAYVAQALLHIRSILDGDISNAVLEIAQGHANWLAGQILIQTPDSGASLLSTLLSPGDPEFRHFVLKALANNSAVEM
jgi:glycosyltransferase involved in cell wall biosynthesis